MFSSVPPVIKRRAKELMDEIRAATQNTVTPETEMAVDATPVIGESQSVDSVSAEEVGTTSSLLQSPANGKFQIPYCMMYSSQVTVRLQDRTHRRCSVRQFH